jgi:hypothetical protein
MLETEDSKHSGSYTVLTLRNITGSLHLQLHRCQNLKWCMFEITQSVCSHSVFMPHVFQISGHMQDAEPSPLAAYGSVISPVAASMKTPSWEIPVLPTLSPHAQITTATQTPGGSLRPSNYESVPAIDTSGSSAVITLPQHASYVPLSPRERKMVEFRESYSPSFLQGHPCRRGRFDMVSVPLTVLGQG